MNPDQTLADIRDAIGGSDYQRACELFEALDEWLRRDGFFPAEWRSPTRMCRPDFLAYAQEIDGPM